MNIINRIYHTTPVQRRRRWFALGGAAALCAGLLLPQAGRAVNVLTQHNDQFRTGGNTNETALTTANVNSTQFGKLFSLTTDGSVYAQPLYVAGLSIGGGTHNVLYVATMENSVYAYDADTGTLLWHVNFDGGSVTPIPIVDITGNNNLNIHGDVGIESTPVIDTNTGTIYVEASFKNTSTTTYYQQLHALSLTNGSEKFGGPTNIVTSGFNPKVQNQRPGLAEANGNIYICWGSHEDITPYQGWMMAYNATNLSQAAVFDTVPSGSQGAVWMAGQAPAIDKSGNLYVTTGNGDWNGTTQWGETCLKLSSTLSVVDWFTPSDYATLNANDTDFGAGGCMLLPNSAGYPNTSYVITGGKEGKIFSLDKANGMGHEAAGDTGAHQIWQAVHIGSCTYHIHGTPVYWNSGSQGQMLYVWGENDAGKAFKFNGTTFTTNAFSQTSVTSPTTGCGMPGSILAISANGYTNGILWASCVYTGDAVHDIVPGILRAYDANNLGTELWDSYQNQSRDDFGNLAKYCAPTVANGKVYMATFSDQVCVYGLLSNTNPSISLINYSFETNTSGTVFTTKITGGFDVSGSDVAGWLDAGTTYNNSGVDYAGDNSNIAENGSVLVYAETGDSGAYQISGYQMQTGDPLTLTWWAKASSGAAGQSVSLMSAASSTTAFSSLTTLATSTATLNQTGNGGAYTQYTLTYTPASGDAGKYAAVFFKASATPTGCWATFDNFALSVQSNSIANGTYKIINRNSGQAMDVTGALTNNGTLVDQYPYQTHANQQWTLTGLGVANEYKIIGVQSGLSLDVTGQSTANGALIDIYPYLSQGNQQWVITPSSGGYYTILGVQSGKLVEVAGSATTNSAPVDQWQSTGGNNQQWQFGAP